MADHLHTIDRWDNATGENLIEQIAGVGDYLALETYRAAVRRWPKDKITLRNRARVLEKTWEAAVRFTARRSARHYSRASTSWQQDQRFVWVRSPRRPSSWIRQASIRTVP